MAEPSMPRAVPEPHSEGPVSMEATPVACDDSSLSNLASDKKTSAWKERGSKNLTYEERHAMLEFLLQRRIDGTSKLVRHAVTDAAAAFRVDRRTVSRLWKRAVQSLENGDQVCDVASRKVGRRGRRKRDWSAELERVKEIPLAQRGSIRALATAVGIPKTTLYELLKEEGRPSIHAIKPSLTDKNKLERLRYCMDKVRPNGLFDDMYNVVHLNLKWFACPRDKKHKVMFLVAVARPQWDPHKNAYFDGKIGAWPFVREDGEGHEAGKSVLMQATLASSRPLRPLETVTKDHVQHMLTHLLLPAIRGNMPVRLRQTPIYIQQDSAKIRCAGDAAFMEEGHKEGWTIHLQHLPPFSPDFAVLNSALFKPMQDAVKASASSTSSLPEVVACVERGFASLTKSQINEAFLALQKAMECTMRVQGSNTYELGATSKEQLQIDGSLPVSIMCDPTALVACRTALKKAMDQGPDTL
ncbi:hypothetical protein PsorP6_013095 [Peronosclerospora sorghi]|uniref:Uncharacterized protein n=1 Tax=Peronosclerospora sorghi TaxID=230839 RepID=A0ACC0WG09_9STRA|nr:hypothetical protein PsorP6_013095 [Peronosclerospora sorghi]